MLTLKKIKNFLLLFLAIGVFCVYLTIKKYDPTNFSIKHKIDLLNSAFNEFLSEANNTFKSEQDDSYNDKFGAKIMRPKYDVDCKRIFNLDNVRLTRPIVFI